MKLWYDDKRIPAWVEVVGLVIFGILLGFLFAVGFMGVSFTQFFSKFI